MKSFVASLVLLALVGSGMCARLRRQAEEEAPASVASSEEEAPASVASAEDDAVATTTENAKADGLNKALSFILGDMQTQQAMGVPVDPKKVDKVLKLSMVLGLVGGEMSDTNKDGIANLLAPPTKLPAEAGDVAF